MEKFVRPASEEDHSLPATYKRTEAINPEALLRRYSDGSYEDELELRGMVKLRAAMLMVMDLINMRKADAEAFALEVKPVLDLMKETRLPYPLPYRLPYMVYPHIKRYITSLNPIQRGGKGPPLFRYKKD